MSSKTKNKLEQSFNTMLTSGFDLESLTVLNLSEHAQVNRVSFYRYFKNILDFLKWFILKDFTLHYDGAPHFDFKDAFLYLYRFIINKRIVVRILFESPTYQHELIEFVKKEVLAYQLRNFSRIDVQKILSVEESYLHASFYASGITQLIIEFISNPKLAHVSAEVYTTYSLRIVKDYVERAIRRKDQNAYDI